MSDAISTRLDRPYAQQPETREAAKRYIVRTGNADILEALGLIDYPPVPQAPENCTTCGKKLPSHGVCRLTARCRAAAREAGVIA